MSNSKSAKERRVADLIYAAEDAALWLGDDPRVSAQTVKMRLLNAIADLKGDVK